MSEVVKYHVQLKRNHRIEEFHMLPSQTLLDAALEAGIVFPNRCQIGACGACLCRNVQGEVHYALDPMLTEQEQREGWVFACQAMVKSDLVIELE